MAKLSALRWVLGDEWDIPMKLRRRGGRKLVIALDGLAGHEAKPTFDEILINALVRAHR